MEHACGSLNGPPDAELPNRFASGAAKLVTRLNVDLNIPDTVSDALREAVQNEARERQCWFFGHGTCSAGVAAELLERTYAEFLKVLKKRGFDYAPRNAETRRPTKRRSAG